MFREFFKSEKSGGMILIGCTIISLIVANTGLGEGYTHFWHQHVDLSFAGFELDYSIEHWINDGLMAIFFLLVGLEIERELYVGELSSFKNAFLPIAAAVGGMVVPALIHFAFNSGTPARSGFGIPMATDIAFALGILSLAGKRVPLSLKVFLTALAIIDDLGAITVIALFYTDDFSLLYFGGAMLVFAILYVIGRMKVHYLSIYLIGGILMWFLMLQSGVHATIAGVLLAFAIPFHKNDELNPSIKLQHFLHGLVAWGIMPIFALANTAIVLPSNLLGSLSSANSLGIMAGLVVGKFTGIFFASFLAVKSGLAQLSSGLKWKHIAGVAFLGGIGFTMSIFITNLAFSDSDMITASKISILFASIVAGIIGLLVLRSIRTLRAVK